MKQKTHYNYIINIFVVMIFVVSACFPTSNIADTYIATTEADSTFSIDAIKTANDSAYNFDFARYYSLSTFRFPNLLESYRYSKTTADSIIDTACFYLNTPYVYGAVGPDEFDCSGFTRYVFAFFGINLPHSSIIQYSVGTEINSISELKKGDLVFFSGRMISKRIGHVGIVINYYEETDQFEFIHASLKGVMISNSGEKYYKKRYLGACRVLDDNGFR